MTIYHLLWWFALDEWHRIVRNLDNKDLCKRSSCLNHNFTILAVSHHSSLNLWISNINMMRFCGNSYIEDSTKLHIPMVSQTTGTHAWFLDPTQQHYLLQLWHPLGHGSWLPVIRKSNDCFRRRNDKGHAIKPQTFLTGICCTRS